MDKLLYKAMIEDIQNEKCTDAELEALLGAFAYTVRKMETTLARKAWYELKDYATAKQYGIDRFTLILERKEVAGQEQWYGVFECGCKNLKVIYRNTGKELALISSHIPIRPTYFACLVKMAN